MWDFGSLTRDGTQVPCSGSVESYRVRFILGEPQAYTVWERLNKKENVKFRMSLRAHANFSSSSFTANPPVL